MSIFRESFNAQSMRNIAKEHIPTAELNIEESIESRIRLNAKMGRNSTSFLNNELISYLKEHQHEYESLGFIITFDNNYGYIEATVYWEE